MEKTNDTAAQVPRPETLSALLALDASRRRVGIEDGLIRLEDCEPRSWDFSAPTLVPVTVRGKYRERRLCPDSAAFARAFYKKYPQLENVPLDGILVAGSSVGQFLDRDAGWTASDVDLFFYGHGDVGATQARLERFIEDLEVHTHNSYRETLRTWATSWHNKTKPADAKWPSGRDFLDNFENIRWSRKGSRFVAQRPEALDAAQWARIKDHLPARALEYNCSVDATRTSGSVTVELRGVKIQCILRHYAAASEILHGFDIGASAVGFDGKQVYLTALGRFAYECGQCVVDTDRRSTTYEARLRKYWNREFGLVLPRLDVTRLPRTNFRYRYCGVAALPRLPFAYRSIKGNRIFVREFVGRAGPTSDYDTTSLADGDEEEEVGFGPAHANLYRLVRGRTDFIYSAAGWDFGAAREVLSKPPHLTLAMIQNLYDRYRRQALRAGCLNTKVIRQFLPMTSLRALMAKAWKADGQLDQKELHDALSEAFRSQREEAMRLWALRIRDADHRKLPWITENPGGQGSRLTGSLNPIAEEPADWYGEYCTPAAAPKK